LVVSDENMLKPVKPWNDQTSGAMSQEKNVTKTAWEKKQAWANR
jgi:hypothetical protein